MSARGDGEWLSAHLFYRDQEPGAPDRLLRDVVAPFVDEVGEKRWVERYFFVRYGELGPHVRLRLRGERSTLCERVRPALEAHVTARMPEGLGSAPQEGASEAGEPSSSPSLWWIPYAPETVRYGGPDGVRLAEELFCHSSRAALALLQGFEPGDSDARFGLALAAMVVLLGSLTRERGEAVMVGEIHRDYWARAAGLDSRTPELRGRYEAGYDRNAQALDQVEAIWAALDEGPAALPEPLDAYAAGAAGVAARLRALQAAGGLDAGTGPITSWGSALRGLAPSYLHMMNNRLGVTPAEESFLAHLVVRSLGR